MTEKHPEEVGEMLEQETWYRFSSGSWILISEMSKDERLTAADRLKRFALSFANTVFRDLYAYGAPMGEQAQWELERAENQAESIMASTESAQQWIVQTPLYEALTGRRAPVVQEDLEGLAVGYEALAADPERVRSHIPSSSGLTVLVYVGISNTDGKLTTEMWQRFHKDVNAVLARDAVGAGTLRWFSPPTEARLGALFAAMVATVDLDHLRQELDKVRTLYCQDEIAFALATENFIK